MWIYLVVCIGTPLRAVKAGIVDLVNNILAKYPEMKISVVAFDNRIYTVVENSSDAKTIISKVNALSDGRNY